MPLIQVKVIEGVFTAPQKHEIIERLTDAMVAIEGENLRSVTWCLVEEVASGEWGSGGASPYERRLDAARKHGLGLRDPAPPELGDAGARLHRPMTLKEQINDTTMKEQA